VLKKRHLFNGPGVPNDIAKIAVVLASDDANWMTGALLPVDGGYPARWTEAWNGGLKEDED
jgi:NAD(P)-dependent dehydrogenase (short-subunit alcohol dehydrogenase family)